MIVTYEKIENSWLAIVAPRGGFTIKNEPVRDTFFKAPYDIACTLAKSFRRSREL